VRWKSHGWEFEKVGRTVRRRSNHKPVELTIEDAVEDIMEHVIEIIPLGAGQTLGADNRVAMSDKPKCRP
jgi:hypothetical protein